MTATLGTTNNRVYSDWANADHAASARAIIRGLSSRTLPQVGYYLHTSGTGILLYSDIQSSTYGQASTHIYDDWGNLSEVTSLPDAAPHREVDKIVLEGGTQHAEKVKTAIICPPTIYGPGRGPGNQRSHQVPELARCTLEKGHGIQVGEGKTFWTSIHVHDLSLLYLSLFRAAVDGHGASRATWGTEGYYFCEAADLVWGDVAAQIAKAARERGWIESDEVVKYEPEDANKLTPMGAALWGCNSRARAVRARKLLGWEPRSPSLDAEIGPTVEVEAKRLGLVVGHAKVAAGDLPTSISNPLGTLGK